jgi:hypothetical protein
MKRVTPLIALWVVILIGLAILTYQACMASTLEDISILLDPYPPPIPQETPVDPYPGPDPTYQVYNTPTSAPQETSATGPGRGPGATPTKPGGSMPTVTSQTIGSGTKGEGKKPTQTPTVTAQIGHR